MKFSQINKGIRAEREVVFDMPDGQSVKLAVRPLTGAEEVDARAKAIALAKARGVEDPRDGHPIHDACFWASVLAIACVDVDSSPAKRDPFFRDAEEVLAELQIDSMALLYERQAVWQEECSPLKTTRSVADLIEMTKQAALSEDGHGFPFQPMSPITRLLWERFMAAHAWTSLALKLPSGSPSPSSGPTGASATNPSEPPS